MKRLFALTVVLSVLLVGMPAVAVAGTVTVNPGDDIQAAIDTASPGDTIVFALGTYSLSSTLTVNKSLMLTSEDPYATGKPVLDGGGTLTTVIFIAADNVTIDGLEITNGKGDLVRQSGAFSGTIVRNCAVHDSSGDEGIQLVACTDCLIECNTIYDVAQDAICVSGSSHTTAVRNNEIYNVGSENAAIYVYESYDITVACNYIHDTPAANGIKMYKNYGGTHTIANNLIVHNAWQGGTRCYDEADGSTINIYKPQTADSTYMVTHNTLADNTGVDACSHTTDHAIYVNDYDNSGAVTNVTDNIATGHGGYGIRVFFGATVNYSTNDLWQNAMGATDGSPVDGGGNISANPLYYGDYTLQAGSPCIGAGSGGQDMGVIFDECGCAPPVIQVTIDIKPGSYPNSINLGAKGVVPVAVLTTDEFDAGTVDPASVVFAGAGPVHWALEDVDGDGDVDLVLHFKMQGLDLDAGNTEATLTGSTGDGQEIQGMDSVRIVPGSK